MLTGAPPTGEAGVVHVAFGSNLSPRIHMVRALAALAGFAEVMAVSPLYRTEPVDADGGAFLNAAAAVRWPADPSGLADLKDRLAAVETCLGRTPGTDETSRANRAGGERWAARTIDLDIVLAGSLVACYGSRPWQVPHPDVTRFAHVTVPLAALAPGPHPATGRPLAEIAAEIAAGLAAWARPEPVDVAGWRPR